MQAQEVAELARCQRDSERRAAEEARRREQEEASQSAAEEARRLQEEAINQEVERRMAAARSEEQGVPHVVSLLAAITAAIEEMREERRQATAAAVTLTQTRRLAELLQTVHQEGQRMQSQGLDLMAAIIGRSMPSMPSLQPAEKRRGRQAVEQHRPRRVARGVMSAPRANSSWRRGLRASRASNGPLARTVA